MADVPIGIFLSGGIDSSLLAAFCQKESSSPILCFTAAFKGLNDESTFASAVAKHIGAEHRCLSIQSPKPEILEELVWHLDEPLGDPACLPTYLLSQVAAKEVKVVLTGEGSDETNLGYGLFQRYYLFQRYLTMMRAASYASPILSLVPFINSRLKHFYPLSAAKNELERISALNSSDPNVVPDTLFLPHVFSNREHITQRLQTILDQSTARDPILRLSHFSQSVFMREDLLMKLDRMTMAHGLEARVPYLDQSLVEMTSTFHPDLLLSKKQSKPLLRALGTSMLPQEILKRKQHGFIVPLSEWFKGDFFQYAESLLSPKMVKKRGLLSSETVANLLLEHRITGAHTRTIWSLVLLELWFRRFHD